MPSINQHRAHISFPSNNPRVITLQVTLLYLFILMLVVMMMVNVVNKDAKLMIERGLMRVVQVISSESMSDCENNKQYDEGE